MLFFVKFILLYIYEFNLYGVYFLFHFKLYLFIVERKNVTTQSAKMHSCRELANVQVWGVTILQELFLVASGSHKYANSFIYIRCFEDNLVALIMAVFSTKPIILFEENQCKYTVL